MILCNRNYQQQHNMKTLFINKEQRVHSELFDTVRLARGLSRFRLAVELEISPKTVRRVLRVGGDPRPATVKKIGDYLGIPAKDWYIQREEIPAEIPER
jgi:transcriptional regulator with XRE-family HTH domain